jgi:uncharacterized integral membrane protein (TIGR00697 family)
MLKIQKLDFLISLYICCIAISELMGAKTFPLFTIGNFPIHASVGIFVVPLIYSINDTITEVFGKEKAQSIVRSGLVMVFFLLLFSLLATHLPPSKRFLPSEKAYEMIFTVSARIAAASLTAFAIAEFLDVFIFIKIRQKFGKKALWLRTNIANFISEFFDTALFITLAFYSLDKPFANNLAFLISLILPYWLLKCGMSIIETPLVYLGVKWLKGKQK